MRNSFFIFLYLLPFLAQIAVEMAKCLFSIVYIWFLNKQSNIDKTSLYSLFYKEPKNVKIYGVFYFCLFFSMENSGGSG